MQQSRKSPPRSEFIFKRNAVTSALAKLRSIEISAIRYQLQAKGGKKDFSRNSVHYADIIGAISSLSESEQLFAIIRYVYDHTFIETSKVMSRLSKKKVHVTTLHRRESKIVEKLYQELWIRKLTPRVEESEDRLKAERFAKY